MVTDAVLSWLVGGATWLIELAPISTFDLSAFMTGWGHVGDLNWFLPIPELQLMILGVMALGPAMLLTTLTSWLMVGVVRGGDSRA